MSEKIKKQCIVLLSGGLDCATVLNIALENFRYNVIIAVFHEIYSFLSKLVEIDKNYSNLRENYKKT